MPDSETPYFEDPDYQNNNLADYFKNTYPLEFRKLGIKRPNYLFNLTAMRRIKNDFPDAKLIVVLRDPVIRFQSAVNHYMKYNFIPVEDINSSIKKIFNDIINLSNYIELRILILMKIIDYYLNTYETDIVKEMEELILGSKKIINLLKNKNLSFNPNKFVVFLGSKLLSNFI